MKVLHQLRGRVRIREPRLMSDEYCRRLTETLSKDERISGVSIKQACWSVAVTYNPDQANAAEIIDMLRPQRKPVKKIQIKDEICPEEEVEAAVTSTTPAKKATRKRASTSSAKSKSKASTRKKATE